MRIADTQHGAVIRIQGGQYKDRLAIVGPKNRGTVKIIAVLPDLHTMELNISANTNVRVVTPAIDASVQSIMGRMLLSELINQLLMIDLEADELLAATCDKAQSWLNSLYEKEHADSTL